MDSEEHNARPEGATKVIAGRSERCDGTVDWLSRRESSVLVDNRRTPCVHFDVALSGTTHLEEGIERTGGTLELDLMPTRIEAAFQCGLPAFRPEYLALVVIAAIILVLVVPMAWPAKIASVVMLLLFGNVIAWLFYRPVQRRLVLTPQTYQLLEQKRIVLEGPLARLEEMSATDDGNFIVETSGAAVEFAAGLTADQAVWLEDMLQEGLAQLRSHQRLLDFDEDE